MITLTLNYINETYSLSTIWPEVYCNGLVLPIIYFTTPLQTTLSQDVTQLSEDNYKYDPNQGMLFNISKGVEAYEAWVAEDFNLSWENQEQDPSTYNSYLTKEHLDDLALNIKYEDDLVLDQLWEDLNKQNNKNFENFLSYKEECIKGSKLFNGRSYNRRLSKTRKSSSNSKKSSRLSLFNKYHPGGKY
jgi:glycyl-tRNA synthetase alpha subunit